MCCIYFNYVKALGLIEKIRLPCIISIAPILVCYVLLLCFFIYKSTWNMLHAKHKEEPLHRLTLKKKKDKEWEGRRRVKRGDYNSMTKMSQLNWVGSGGCGAAEARVKGKRPISSEMWDGSFDMKGSHTETHGNTETHSSHTTWEKEHRVENKR